LAVQVYYTQTGRGYDTQAPFGTHASYLSLMIADFNTAGEKGWGISADVDFASLGARGLTASATYASGSDRIDSADGSALPNRSETDVRVDYAIGKGTVLEGLVATFRYAWLEQDGSPHTQTQLRAYLNYAVRF
jgi:outer membrane porin, OprD family